MTNLNMISRRTLIATILSLYLLRSCTAFAPRLATTTTTTTTTTGVKTHAFGVPPHMLTTRTHTTPFSSSLSSRSLTSSSSSSSSSTKLQMYKLPPQKEDNGLSPVVTTILSVVGVIAFFASPLGSIFFAVTNTLFVLALLIPITAVIAFQTWQYFNTVTAPCPSCGAPVQVLKSQDVTPDPTICLNCGSVVVVNAANDGVDFATNNGNRGGPSGVVGDGDDAKTLLDMLFGGGSGNGDGYGNVAQQRRSESGDTTGGPSGGPSSSFGGPKSTEQKYRRQGTIIDVDVEKDNEDDKPFQ